MNHVSRCSIICHCANLRFHQSPYSAKALCNQFFSMQGWLEKYLNCLSRQKTRAYSRRTVELDDAGYRHNLVKASRHASSRTITASEVRDWFGKSPKSQLGNAQYREIAAFLTKIRWPSDPGGLLGPQPPTVETESDDYWDFDAAFDAAKLLLESMPNMLRHWSGLLWAPETSGGHPAIKALQDTLAVALPYIKWPFGEGEPQTGRKKPKVWHLSAILIARIVIKAMVEAGHNNPGITRNSIVVRVVRKALIRMQYPHIQMITASAVGAHLARWDKKYGLTPEESRA